MVRSNYLLNKKIFTMVGIKDVAKLAGVSHGTVSNVLRGDTYVSPEKVKKVKGAVNKLDYKRNIVASRLKSKFAKTIGLVMPNIDDSNFSLIYKGIERVLFEKDYHLSLFTTNEESSKENFGIVQLLQLKSQGLIIITCQPENTSLFKELESSNIGLILLERKVRNSNFNIIQYNNYQSIYDVVIENLQSDRKNILLITGPIKYSNEKQCINAYKKAYEMLRIKLDDSYIRSISLNKESSFIETINFLKENMIEVIITTSSELLEGVLKGLSLLGEKKLVISLSEYRWTSNRYRDVVKIYRNPIKLGELAAERIVKVLENNKNQKHLSLNLHNFEIRKPNEPVLSSKKKILKILMMDDGFGPEATAKLIQEFENTYNVKTKSEALI